MKKNLLQLIMGVLTICTLLTACGDDDDKDMTPPEISSAGITPNPIDCQVYHPGETIPFCYVFQDDTELGSFNIEVHTNADHHSHSTSATECEDDDHDHEGTGGTAWVFNHDYTIPTGQRTYTARVDIDIPADIAAGDYHFMIRLTDRAGWQQLKAIAIKIEND